MYLAYRFSTRSSYALTILIQECLIQKIYNLFSMTFWQLFNGC
ncbi:hypothetical protein C427_1156 [Paraglaciecola psychrophila 170]|uniref:Uncharacterized protein n=1 Tax=Paraglaciecola psychrophila 170 TaxID=1129794 RepID=M4RI89_9ALTE|nr:hypothetical protein C427_1156 [Paraglaciecola psychrophila 170]